MLLSVVKADIEEMFVNRLVTLNPGTSAQAILVFLK